MRDYYEEAGKPELFTTDDACDVLISGGVKFYTYVMWRTDKKSPMPFYVGKATVIGGGRSTQRLSKHIWDINNGYCDNPIKGRVIKKLWSLGLDVLFQIDQIFEEESDAWEREVELIAHYGRRDNKTGILANLSDGGEGQTGKFVSAEARARQSASMLTHYAENPDSASKRGEAIRQFYIDNPEKGAERAATVLKWRETNPEAAAEHDRRVAEYNRRPEQRERRSKQMKEICAANPEMIIRRAAKIKETSATPESKLRRSISQRKWRAENPELEEARRVAAAIAISTPEYRQAASERMCKRRDEQPEEWAEQLRRAAEAIRSPERRAAQSIISREWHANNPEGVKIKGNKCTETKLRISALRNECTQLIDDYHLDVGELPKRGVGGSLKFWTELRQRIADMIKEAA